MTSPTLPIYQVQNVSKSYKKRGEILVVLKNLKLQMAPGEFATIQGPTGGGKSTLLQFLGALDTPDEETIQLGTHQLTKSSSGQLTKVRRDYIGFVFQDFNLIPTLNAYKNVNTALEGRAIFNAEGLTIIAVTHDSGVAARAKRRLHLKGGQIFDESDPALRRHSTQGPLIARGIAGRKLRRRTQEEKLKPGCLEMCCENLQATRLLP